MDWGGGVREREESRVLRRLWVCAMRWAMVPFIEVGKARARPGWWWHWWESKNLFGTCVYSRSSI